MGFPFAVGVEGAECSAMGPRVKPEDDGEWGEATG
ncbi:hypothetical protein RLEG3_13815 [Rhizobium leguminosarum bv. trifolii WSM1689]|nr:hypothetical protein RLEG3_13815 [Rhizobium leguminosarum bv. trifolii WSM1689]